MMIIAIRNYLARLQCRLQGHPRGKRIDPGLIRCRRCGAEWGRPSRKKAEAA